MQADLQWSRKFLSDPWEPLMQEWNAQPVFRFDRVRPPRKENEFSRVLLSKALEHWSLGTQDDMRLRLREFKCPIYYIHGDKDEKFAEVGAQLKARVPGIEVNAVSGGHSPQFSNPGDIVRRLKSFFNRIYREQVI
jgi:2-succinyl-6-hydroxy-2,4-cyclohexadiene-1-carboxylate synthase